MRPSVTYAKYAPIRVLGFPCLARIYNAKTRGIYFTIRRQSLRSSSRNTYAKYALVGVLVCVGIYCGVKFYEFLTTVRRTVFFLTRARMRESAYVCRRVFKDAKFGV